MQHRQQIRLEREDFESTSAVEALASQARMATDQFCAKFRPVIEYYRRPASLRPITAPHMERSG